MQPAENLVIAERFRLGRMIGRGGMGSVWAAQHLSLEIPCAVKFIEGDMASHPESLMRFEREAKAAAQLRSPHVVQIFEHGLWDGTPYIAMELLDGEDLGKRFEHVGVMPPPQLHQILSQVCRALTKAHGLGIVHRDLKPDNIFLVRDDDREIAKVLDFGIAKKSSTELGAGSNTKTGAMLGTPYYMSPEQAQGTKAVDFRSDLWSMAVIAFQGLTGRLPFESDALGDLLMKIMVSEMPVPSQYGCRLPGADAFWKRAASRDPAGRYQSAKEFADALGLVCGVSHISASHDRASILASGTPVQGGGVLGQTRPEPGPPAGGTTPSPVAHTFGAPSAVPKKNLVPLIVGFGAAGLGVVVLALVLALGKSKPAEVTTAAPSPLPAASEAPAAPPPVAATAAPPTTAAEPAPSSAPAATVAELAVKPAAAKPTHAPQDKPEKQEKPEKPAPKPAAAAKAPRDMGF